MVGGLLVDGGDGGRLCGVVEEEGAAEEDRETLDTRLSRALSPRVGGPRLQRS